jgi:hypothetical protein
MSCNHAYVNFKFQTKKYGAVITIFSSLLLGKQGYCEFRREIVYFDIFITSFARKERLF